MITLKLTQVVVTVFFCSYFAYLYSVGKIGYYINTKYYYPTLLAITVSSIFGIIALWFIIKGYSSLRKKPSIGDYSAALLSILLCVSLFLVPIKPLSSSSIVFTSTPRIFTNTQKTTTSTIELSTQTVSNLTIKDWLIAFKSSSNPKSFIGQKVKLTGFIAEPDTTKNSYKLGRFQVSCCLSDAQFYFISVTSAALTAAKDDWVDLEGEFTILEGKLVIIQKTTTVIPTPQNPYF
jgi:uncharacterized repeat protein (TIGR03943 family)